MSKNGDIRGFFAKKTARPLATNTSSLFEAIPTSQRTRQPTSETYSQAPSLDLPSSPITPQKKSEKTALTRDTEIKESDDDDSDASLESLGEMYGRKSKPSFQRPAAQTTTPKAKRVASASLHFYRSPMTIRQQPKHKFDMKTLAAHSNQVKATEASSRRAEEAKAKAEKDLEPEADPDKMAGEVLSDEDEGKGDKLAMAIDRTAGDESHLRAYFFNQEDPPYVPRRQFPKAAVKAKPWNILQDSDARNQTFIHGLPTALARKGKELPDELYLWILDEICVEKDLQLRSQYINLASLCHDDTRRLVNEVQLYKMLETIGGPQQSEVNQVCELSPGLSDPYPGRDWSHLRYFLELLSLIAPNLASETKVDAINLLLRLSLDPVVTTVAGLQASYAKAMLALVTSLPVPGELWNDCVSSACKRNMAPC